MSVDEIEFEAEERMEKAVEYLKGEFKGVRTGRASPGLVEHLKVVVPSYGEAPMDLRSLATISIPDPATIMIKPFDPGTLKDIEKAIQTSDIGINPRSDGKVIRLPIPPLSGERRQQIVGQLKKLAEAQKIAVRNVRREAVQKVDTGKKDGDIPEDDAKKSHARIDEMIKKCEKELDTLLATKTKEVEQV